MKPHIVKQDGKWVVGRPLLFEGGLLLATLGQAESIRDAMRQAEQTILNQRSWFVKTWERLVTIWREK